jgi:hypothetical protein
MLVAAEPYKTPLGLFCQPPISPPNTIYPG